MQSGYGGVSEVQQFMVDSAAHTLFSSPPNPSAAAAAAVKEIHHPAAVQTYKFNPFHHHHHQPSPSPAVAPEPHFPHFHSIPITHHLFTQHPGHFQLFHPHQPALDHDPVTENSSSGSLAPRGGESPSFLPTAMNFKLAVNDGGRGSGGREGLNNDNVDIAGNILHGYEGSESRLRPWHRDEECAIKEPSWRPLDLDFINHNNKRYKDKQPGHNFSKRIHDAGEPQTSHTAAGINYKIFSELEAIYKPGGGAAGAIAVEEAANNSIPHRPNQAGSGSALTGDEHNLMPPTAAALATDSRIEDDNSTGGEAHTKINPHQHSRSRRRRRQLQLGSVAAFFEGLMKQLMDQQEALHRKFLDAMERNDRERVVREEAWREHEAARSQREADIRAHERALSAVRESAVISFLEKITGEALNLPIAATGNEVITDQKIDDGGVDENKQLIATIRWPKEEVQALIQVRSGLEARFQEPGLKGALWEEVSAGMEAMGYRRNAKRCKEKWENINKYFRKTKESSRKRSLQPKTCPYFQQLDQLYSSSSKSFATPPSPSITGNGRKKNSELLDAIVVSTDNRMFFGSKLSRAKGEEEGGESNARLKEQEGQEEDEDEDDDEVAAEMEGFRSRD